MHREHYGRVIQEWCSVTGMTAWSEDEDKHIEIDGVVCGLLPGDEAEPDRMHLFIDLGQHDSAGLHRHLLEQNARLGEADHGCFGLHPVTGSIVYRTSFNLTLNTDGAQLPEKIRELIDSAQEHMAAMYIQ